MENTHFFVNGAVCLSDLAASSGQLADSRPPEYVSLVFVLCCCTCACRGCWPRDAPWRRVTRPACWTVSPKSPRPLSRWGRTSNSCTVLRGDVSYRHVWAWLTSRVKMSSGAIPTIFSPLIGLWYPNAVASDDFRRNRRWAYSSSAWIGCFSDLRIPSAKTDVIFCTQ